MAADDVATIAHEVVRSSILEDWPERRYDWLSATPAGLGLDDQNWWQRCNSMVASFDKRLETMGCGPVAFPKRERNAFIDQPMALFVAELAARAEAAGCP